MASQEEWIVARTSSRVDLVHERTEFSLNTRFTTFDDLDNLETLLSDVQQRNETLQFKLASSTTHVNHLLSEARQSIDTHLHTAAELSLLRHSLTDELSELVPELTSTMSSGEANSTLLEEVETFHRTLKELESVKEYVQIVQHALKLSESSDERIRSLKTHITGQSLSDYKALQDFVTKVSEEVSKQGDSSGEQDLHLLRFLEGVRDSTWQHARGSLARILNDCAEKLGWPMPVDYSIASFEDRNKFEQAFCNLLEFQHLGERMRSFPDKNPGLYPLHALIEPISLRFKYHFDGKRETNRADKPEWYFTHVLNLVHDHRPFMESIIQRLLTSSNCVDDAWTEFVASLLSLLSRKLKKTIPSLLSHPPLLAHTIYQTLLFDAALSEAGFALPKKYDSRKEEWKGLSNLILENTEWFDIWLDGEHQFAEDQYHNIISTADAWSVEDANETYRNTDMRSTHSARRFRSLIEQITDRYSPLPHFSQRTRFLLSIQFPLLDQYCDRITSSLDAFETLSSAFVRALPGGVTLGSSEGVPVNMDTTGLTSGTPGVQRLCKAWLSAKYMEVSLQRWGEDLFFVELWTEMNNQRDQWQLVDISSWLLPALTADSQDVSNGTLFDILISRYSVLVDRAEGMITHQVCKEVESALTAHLLADPSSQQKPMGAMAFPQSLLVPLSILSSHLGFLRMVLPQATLTGLYRRIASTLAEHIFQRQISLRGAISPQEGQDLHAEHQLWVESCHTALAGALGGTRARVEAPWAKLLHVGGLLGAEGDTLATISEATFGTQSDAQWEGTMVQIFGSVELQREEVANIMRQRDDCNR